MNEASAESPVEAGTDRGPGSEDEDCSWAPRRSYELRILRESRIWIAASGYVARVLNTANALEGLGGDDRLRIELDPGLHFELRVLDAETDEPVAGVLFRSATAGTLRSDDEGWARLAADHWSTFEVEKPGYEPETWDPEWEVLRGQQAFYMFSVDTSDG